MCLQSYFCTGKTFDYKGIILYLLCSLVLWPRDGLKVSGLEILCLQNEGISHAQTQDDPVYFKHRNKWKEILDKMFGK